VYAIINDDERLGRNRPTMFIDGGVVMMVIMKTLQVEMDVPSRVMRFNRYIKA